MPAARSQQLVGRAFRINTLIRGVKILIVFLFVCSTFAWYLRCKKLTHLNNLLVEAVKQNNVVQADRLLREGADPNFSVTKNGFLSFLDLLLRTLRLKHTRVATQFTPTSFALDINDKTNRMIKLLLLAGGNPNSVDALSRPALLCFASSWHEDIDAIKIVIIAGADVNASTCDGRTALMESCGSGQRQTTKILLDATGREYVNKADTEGYTALMDACRHGDEPIVGMLLSKSSFKVRRI